MQSVPSTELPHRTYVVTYGMAHRLQLFRSGAFRVPHLDDALFKTFQTSLLERVQLALPEITVRGIHMDELESTIWERVGHSLNGTKDPIVISTCSELASASRLTRKIEGHTLNFNRLFNTDGEIIGYGPRHGFSSLNKQFDDLALKIGNRPVILIEDGAFSGKTLCFILDKLKAYGLKVPTVIMGFCCARAEVRLKESFSGEMIIVEPIKDLVDWIPDHDLIPFTPNCGRVLGEQTPNGFVARETEDGHTYAYPYILPFGKMNEWSSLPLHCIEDLSRFCLDASISFFSEIGEYVGHKITIRDLRRGYPRFPIPIAVGAHDQIPPPDTEIVSFLRQTREGLQ